MNLTLPGFPNIESIAWNGILSIHANLKTWANRALKNEHFLTKSIQILGFKQKTEMRRVVLRCKPKITQLTDLFFPSVA